VKVLVSTKQVADPYARIPINNDGLSFDLKHVRMTLNPFDEIAVEEALLIQEKNTESEIVAVTIGNSESVDAVRTALAMGVNRGIHILSDEEVQPLGAAKVLAEIVKEEQPDLVLMGKQAVDDESNQTGQILAGLLDWPQATFASNIKIERSDAIVEREVDEGREVLIVSLPAVITVDLRLNQPRYPTLPNLLKARKARVEQRSATSLGVDMRPRIKTINIKAPEQQRDCSTISSAAQLLEILAEKGVL